MTQQMRSPGPVARIAEFHPTTPLVQEMTDPETWCAAWSPDGRYFAWSRGFGLVTLVPWDNERQHPVSGTDGTRINTRDSVRSLAFGNKSTHSSRNSGYQYRKVDGLILATGHRSSRIRVWEVKTGSWLLDLQDHLNVVTDVKFAPDGSLRLASASRDTTLKVWQVDDGNLLTTLRVGVQMNACCFSPNSQLLCGVGDASVVHLWDMESYKPLGRLLGHHHCVVSCEFSPDGLLLATASYDTTVIIWDPHAKQLLIQLQHLHPPPSRIYAGGDNGHYLRGVSFSPGGVYVASCADDQFVRFWNLCDPEIPENRTREKDPLCCSFSPDGSVLAVGTRSGMVSTWQAPMEFLPLQHLCRMIIRRNVHANDLDNLPLPGLLKNFLRFNVVALGDANTAIT